MMTGLAGKVHTPFWFLLIAGVVMVLTLWYSKKAQSVTDTEIGLARDTVGHESFQSSVASRAVVGSIISTGSVLKYLFPRSWRSWVMGRFANENKSYSKEAPAFDLVRASVNLTVASVLIAIATSMKLPLSTTYVTFMVAMGTTLADGVW
ncbi:MAG: hypothetical protein H6765_03095 [Candidatus Peribacteria bacterium]|nr:MAG: hypothetical protein H6765_03095 [Candidatus Peribacteria bacterium]